MVISLSLLTVVAPYNVEVTGMRRYPYGSNIELTCTSEGGPQLEYSWIFLNSTVGIDSVLNISNVAVSNGGDYTCNVTNDAGYDIYTATVYSAFNKIDFTQALFVKLHVLC